MMDVLLVDDEPWVLEGLRTMVNWDKYGFQICGRPRTGMMLGPRLRIFNRIL